MKLTKFYVYLSNNYQYNTIMLKIENVVKRFRDKTAVNNLSFEIDKGVIFGLLGPNGAGKTTLIRMINNIFKPDSGSIYLNGELLNSFHPKYIGYMPEERGLYKKMKVGEQLIYLTQLKGFSKKEAEKLVYNWIDRFQIRGWLNKKVDELSKGMQQKVQFISTVAHNPVLIILDEPFTGLDPVNTELIKDVIFELKENGATIIFSTHRMEQVEEVCEDLALINNGKLIIEGKTNDIKNKYKENKYRIVFNGKIKDDFYDKYNIDKISENEFVVKLLNNQDSKKLLKDLLDQHIEIVAFYEVLPSLNEIFIKLVS